VEMKEMHGAHLELEKLLEETQLRLEVSVVMLSWCCIGKCSIFDGSFCVMVCCVNVRAEYIQLARCLVPPFLCVSFHCLLF